MVAKAEDIKQSEMNQADHDISTGMNCWHKNKHGYKLHSLLLPPLADLPFRQHHAVHTSRILGDTGALGKSVKVGRMILTRKKNEGWVEKQERSEQTFSSTHGVPPESSGSEHE